MCIMEVRPGQRTATIAQAMAHNTSTVERDLDMFVPILEARGEQVHLERINAAHQALKVAYENFLACFADLVVEEIEHEHEHAHEDAGHERTFVATAKRDIKTAKKYETR